MSIAKSLCYNSGMRKSCRTGFTLVEMSISIVFVGILSVAMALIISNSVASYRRGNTLGQVNSIGMDLVDDMRAAVQVSSAKTLSSTCAIVYASEGEREKCNDDSAYNFVSVLKKTDVTLFKDTDNEEKIDGVPIYGVFCTGTYSYIWNSGYFWSSDASFNEKSSGGAKINQKSGAAISDFRFLKVKDESREICIAAVYDKYNTSAENSNKKYNKNAQFASNVIDISNINDGNLSEAPIYLIDSEGASNLALYDLTVARPAVSTENNSVFYSVSFILGTIDGGINIKSANSACATPNEYESLFDYCAINKFSFAARATGE